MAAAPVYTPPPTSHAQGHIIRDGYAMLTDVLAEPLHELHCEADITPQYFVVFEVFPFAAGAQRLAFKGSIFERLPPADPAFRVHVVVKMEMAQPDTVTRSIMDRTRITGEEARKTIKKHDLAARYVEKWCKLGINKSVYVLSTEQLRLTRGCTLSDIDPARFPMLHHLFKKLALDAVLYKDAVGTVEDYLPGRFTKFLNNDGNANHAVTANFPGAFAHWSWVESGGELMVSDIQGVRTGAGYILTDPCVHSVRDADGFGMSDLGMIGIEEFFEKHRCNELCNDLGLGKDGADLDLGHALRTRLVPRKGGTVGRDPKDKGTTEAESWVNAAAGEEMGDTKTAKRSEDVKERGASEALRQLEASQGKIQRRATLRVFDKDENGKDEPPEDSAEARGRRKTFAVADDFRDLKKRGGARKGDVKGRREDMRNMFLTGVPSLFRLRRKATS